MDIFERELKIRQNVNNILGQFNSHETWLHNENNYEDQVFSCYNVLFIFFFETDKVYDKLYQFFC